MHALCQWAKILNTKISQSENFPIYGILEWIWHFSVSEYFHHSTKQQKFLQQRVRSLEVLLYISQASYKQE